MVGGEDNQVVRAGPPHQARNPPVELLESTGESAHIVAMPPALIELDHIGEEEPAPHRRHRTLDQRVGIGIGVGVDTRDTAPGEEIVHLANTDHWEVGRAQMIEEGGSDRR